MTDASYLSDVSADLRDTANALRDMTTDGIGTDLRIVGYEIAAGLFAIAAAISKERV